MSLFHSLGQLLSRNPQTNKANSRRRKRTLHDKRGLLFESLEPRFALAVTSFAGGELTIDLNFANEGVGLDNDGMNITLTSSNAITGAGASFTTANVNRIVFTDVGALAGQSLEFNMGTALTLSNGLLGTGVERVTFNNDVIATGTSAISITAPRNIALNADLTGGSGGVTLSANQQVAPTGGMFRGVIVNDATITTTGNGNVSVTGRGGDTLTDNYGVWVQTAGRITAGGSGTVTVTGTGGTSTGDGNYGVYVTGMGSEITSNGGAVVVDGTGGGAGSSSDNYGVYVEFTGVITSAGTGSGVTVMGQGGNTTGTSNIGVLVTNTNSRITSSGGAVLVQGTGTSNSAAVQLQNSGAITSGTNAAITITADSMDIRASSSGINAGTGIVTLRNRTAGTLINLGGADVLSGSPLTLGLTSDELNRITAGTLVIGRNDIATGTVTVSSAIAPANATTLSIITARNIAVNATANVTGGTGGVTLSANQQVAPTSGNFIGVDVNNAIITTTGNGNVSVTGRGGDTGGENSGVMVRTAGRITANGSGTVMVTGTGGASIGAGNMGVWVLDTASQITSSGGAVLVDGTGGGTGASTDNYGVYLQIAGVITSAGIGSGATVTVRGQGGNITGTGGSNIGVFVTDTDSRITSSGGAVQVQGAGASNSAAVWLQFFGAITSGSNAAITITADSVNILADSGGINSGTGTTTIRTRTAGTLIDLGGADVLTGNPLTLGLTSAELNQITAGTLVIGRNDIATGTGTVTVSSAIAPANATTLSLITGANITGSAAITETNVALRAATGISLTGANAITTVAIANTTSGGVTLQVANGVTVGTVDSLAGITANGQSVAVTATAGTITVNQAISATGAGGSVGLTTPGNIVVNGSVTTTGGNITLSANDGITLSNAISSGGGNIVLQADADANGTGSLVLSAAVMASFAQQAQLNATDGAANDRFGVLVAFSSDGNTAIVGAHRDDVGANVDQGTATVFTLSAGVWTQQQQLIAIDGAASDRFGYSVALSSDGNTAIVGAIFDDVGANTDQGTATVFTRTAGVWTQQQQLTATLGAAGDDFGFDVGLSSDGNTAIVGADLDDVGANTDQGTATVFTRSAGVWTQQQQLTAADGAANDGFGILAKLSSDGNTAIVGAYLDDVGVNANQGTATVFTRTAGVWTQQQQLTAALGAAGDEFGFSVALSSDGNTAIVGAYNDDVGANTDQGTATVFTRVAGVWTQQQQLAATVGAAGDQFGWTVALSSDGNTAIVGAINDDVGAIIDQGSATVFTRSAGVWTQQQQLAATGGAADDGFGNSVAISSDGNSALVAASVDDVGANTNQGSAYTFTLRVSIASGTGTVSISAADADLQGTITSTNTVSITVTQAGRAIDLGTNTAGALGLTDAELDQITAGTLLIGDAMSGAITVSSAITHGNNLTLTTGTTITANQAVTLATNKSLAAGAENSIAINARVTTAGGDVLLEAGNDITLLSASVAGNLTINGDIGTRNIRLGGNGTLQGVGEAESVSVGGNLEISAGTGNGDIFVNTTTVVGALSIVGGSGTGENKITAAYTSTGGNLTITGGAGYDLVQQTQVSVGAAWTINVGAGNDLISIAQCSAGGLAQFNSGLGIDMIAAAGSQFFGGVAMDGSAGGGAKTLRLENTTVNGIAVLTGGLLDDILEFLNITATLNTVSLNSGDGNDNVTVQTSVLRQLFAELGAGNDLLTVNGTRSTVRSTLLGNIGLDTYNRSNNAFTAPQIDSGFETRTGTGF